MLTHFKNTMVRIWYWCTLPEYRILKKSLYFQAEYYLATNPDVAATGTDPLLHYITRGYAERRRPGPLFDILYYLKQVPALKEDQDPLLHYLQEGWSAGLKANPLFDPAFYRRENPEVNFNHINPLSHLVEKGTGLGGKATPSPYFDASYYRNKYPDVLAGSDHPLVHYLIVGAREARRPSLYFDPDWYLDRTPVLRERGIDPLSHYFNFGIQEKKSPSPLFDPVYYAQTYNLSDQGDLFAHYLKVGAPADQRPCAWFDPAYYRRQYMVPQGDDSPPLAHYLAHGLSEGLYPNQLVAELPVKPTISLIVPVYNVAPAHLNNCIRSVLYQSYPHWQLCLVDDCSTEPTVRPLLEFWAAQDSRIQLKFLPDNLGISGATNAAVELASGQYLGFLDNDDELASDCLFTVVQHINTDGASLYYSDEDLIGEDGRQFSVFSKPGFNSELLLCHNYITHFVVVEKALFEMVGGFAAEMDGAQDYDLFLKLSEQTERIVHIPDVLYHWRASESSTSINHDQKEYANEAGRKAVAKALERRGIAGEVKCTDWKFYYRPERTILEETQVTIVVCWDQLHSDIGPWLQALAETAGYSNFQLHVSATDRTVCDAALHYGTSANIQVYSTQVGREEGLAQVYNQSLESIESDFVAFVSSDLNFSTIGWLAALVEYGQQEDVGMVGGRLDCAAPHLDSVTPVPDLTLPSPLYFARFLQDCSVLMNGLHCPQQVRSVCWELCLLRTDVLKEAGGFNSVEMPLLFAIHDLCFRLQRQGLKQIYTPYSQASWRADARRFRPQEYLEKWRDERAVFKTIWQAELRRGDQFYNTSILQESCVSETQFQAWLCE